jgi:hypothetical protein
LQLYLDGIAKVQGLLGNTESSEAYAKAAASIREFASAGAEYGDMVLEKFKSGDTAVARLAKSLETTKTETGEAGKAAEAAAASFKKLTTGATGPDKDAIKKANEELKKQAGLIAELGGLSGSFYSEWNRLNDAYKKGTLSLSNLTAMQAALLAKQPAMKEMHKSEIDAAKEHTKEVDALFDAQEKLRMGNEDQIKTARTMLEQIEFETKLLGLNAEQRAIATLERDLETKGIVKGTQAYDAYIQRLKDATALKGVTEAQIKAADDANKAWTDTAKDIEKALTDSLMRGFESGKSMVDSVRDYITNAFKSIVVKMMVQPIMGAIGGMMGMGSAVAGVSGGDGGASSSALSSASLLSGLGGAFGAGASWLTGAAGGGSLMGSLSAGASLMGTGSLAGIGSGLSMLAGAVAPIAIGVALLSKAMQYTVTPNGNVLVADVGSKGLTDGASNRADFIQQGGLFGGGTTHNSDWSKADAGTNAYITAAVQAYTSANAAYAGVLGLSATAMDGFTKHLEISVTGMDSAAAQAAINAEAAQFAIDQVSAAYGTAIAQFAHDGETMVQTLQRLAQMQMASTVLNEFGGVFSRLATLGVEGRDSMIALAGGIDALIKKSSDFVKDYYTQAEQSGLAARGVLSQLSAAGIQDAGALQSREQYRALVEAMDVSTQAGREQLNLLLTLAPQFAQVADALKTQGGDLGALALLAPQIAALDPLFQQSNDAATTAADATTASINATTDAVTAGTVEVVGAIGGMAATISAAVATALRETAAAASASSSAIASKLDSIDSIGRLSAERNFA